MLPAGLPLLIVPFALYNILVFLAPGVPSNPGISWNKEISHIHMISGGDWVLTLGDALVAGSVVILLIEMMRAARRASRRTIMSHVLSMVLFVGMLVEFMTVTKAASSTFFLLLVIGFVDVAAGFVVSIRSARRDILLDEAGSAGV
ncbi:MAG: hypothetical protein J2P53_14430 [Bradyrhizobiaceae bacterium]|nr:hypothetical protein [Bradyrhizobiaceae bacterium]